MERFRLWMTVLACVLLLAGCGQGGEKPAQASAGNGAGTEPVSAGEQPETAQAAYETFLAGDISLFDDGAVETWGLDGWKDSILACGELEYTCMDLDGDGGEELLVQWVDDPAAYNGVFRYADGALTCWQHDSAEGSCRDYPLQDGTMVRQYDLGGACSYTIFRYQSDGEAEELGHLLAREELLDPASTEPCPYYAVDGQEVEKSTFEEQLRNLIENRLPDRSAWTAIR